MRAVPRRAGRDRVWPAPGARACEGLCARDGVNRMRTSATRRKRLARRFGWERNPLRRRSDLISAWLAPAMAIAFLALCPFVVVMTANWARVHDAAKVRAEASWRPVQAVLLRSVPGPAQGYAGSAVWLTMTPARWVAYGVQHTGAVPVRRGSMAGSHVQVWVDQAGDLRPAPLTKAEAGESVVETAVGAAAGLGTVMLGLTLLVRWVLYRRKIASWESGWLSVGPAWTRHH